MAWHWALGHKRMYRGRVVGALMTKTIWLIALSLTVAIVAACGAGNNQPLNAAVPDKPSKDKDVNRCGPAVTPPQAKLEDPKAGLNFERFANPVAVHRHALVVTAPFAESDKASADVKFSAWGQECTEHELSAVLSLYGKETKGGLPGRPDWISENPVVLMAHPQTVSRQFMKLVQHCAAMALPNLVIHFETDETEPVRVPYRLPVVQGFSRLPPPPEKRDEDSVWGGDQNAERRGDYDPYSTVMKVETLHDATQGNCGIRTWLDEIVTRHEKSAFSLSKIVGAEGRVVLKEYRRVRAIFAGVLYEQLTKHHQPGTVLCRVVEARGKGPDARTIPLIALVLQLDALRLLNESGELKIQLAVQVQLE